MLKKDCADTPDYDGSIGDWLWSILNEKTDLKSCNHC